MRIRTILLNWNRKPLLKKCLQSYAATIDSRFQLIVIDNSISDGSREVIERFCAELPDLKPIFLDQNEFTPETEVLDFLYTLIRLIKPERALGTGTWLGRSAVAIASAMRDNAFGKLVSLEIDPEAARCPLAEIVGAVQNPPELTAFRSARTARNPCEATANRARERAAILILGMHRSGTSALARVLNLLGAALPEGLLGPGCGNTLGHWESELLMRMDDEILLAMGRTWDDPRQIPSGWFRSRTAYTFHERLREGIVSEYGDAPLVVIKEPRICRLAPLYLDVLDALGIRPYVVLPVRHPVEVIRSICDRDDLDPATIEFLWLRYVLEAEAATRSCRRVWTGYDRLLNRWAPTVQSIASGLGITWPNEPEKVRPVIEEFLRPRHRHYQVDKDSEPPHLGHLTIRAWVAVQHCLDGNETAAQMIFDEIGTALKELDRMSFPREEAAQRRLLALEAELNDQRHGLANSEASLCEIRGRLAQADEKNAQPRTSRDEIARLSVAAQRELKLETDLKLANDQISCLNKVVESLNGRISSMLASRSWQITAPLRVLQRWILGQ